jgi:FkbM family methyltransferase
MGRILRKAKHVIYKALKPLALKIGFVESNSNGKPLPGFMYLLANTGYKPKVIFDIGANYGTWTNIASNYFPSAQYFLFEPNPIIANALRQNYKGQPLIRVVEKGVGAISETRKFTVHSRHDSGSFIIDDASAFENGFEQIPIEIVSLDDFMLSNKMEVVPDIIKIDAEGLDLEVIEGMKNTCLGKSELIFVEAAVLSNTFPNTVEKVVNKMHEAGYSMVDITDINRPFGFKGLWLIEIAFALKDGKVINSLRKFTIDSTL